MTAAGSAVANCQPDLAATASTLSASTMAARAMRALRAGKPELAWFWADTLCRITMKSADAYLLRSAALTKLGDDAGAEADLRLAVEIDPNAPTLNRALLGTRDAGERLRAARRLLDAASAEDRNHGLSALSREGIQCVGLLEIADHRLTGRVVWNGPVAIALRIRTDVNEWDVPAQSSQNRLAPAFERGCYIDLELPPAAQVVTIESCDLKALFAPATLLLTADGAPRSKMMPPHRELLIIVPVYADCAATLACLNSLVAASPDDPSATIAVVDDASPDLALSAELDRLAAAGRITLLRNAINMGFAGSVNRAMVLRHPGQDLLLLNADTIVPTGALRGLARHVRDNADVGTVTPLSNNGESTSFPCRFLCNPMPNEKEIAALHAVAARANTGRAVDMPNGIGFCLYVRGELCDSLGRLPHSYGRGYYEDVEFCLRAAAAGYRNVCATDVFVGHHGSRSFAQEKRALVTRNLRQLNARYPAYRGVAKSFELADPLRQPIARIEEAVLRGLPTFDLLLAPAVMPAILQDLALAAAAREGCKLVMARVSHAAKSISITLSGRDGTLPQNIEWPCADPQGADRDLERLLAGWSIGRLTILDASALPPDVVNVFRRRAAIEQRIDRDRIPAMSRVQRPALELPRLALTSGVLAIVGLAGRAGDHALLCALARTVPATEDRPPIVVAGCLAGDFIDALPASVQINGPIDDAELPNWLTHLGPAAVLFADRDWGMADPRATRWSEAGLAIARFDKTVEQPQCHRRSLLLPHDGSANADADAIVSWMRDDQA